MVGETQHIIDTSITLFENATHWKNETNHGFLWQGEAPLKHPSKCIHHGQGVSSEAAKLTSKF